jgi:hypothetical protein
MATEKTTGLASAQFQHLNQGHRVFLAQFVAFGFIEVLSWQC